ncbi:MAG: flagellar M-ring protein FliF [Microbacteriaceae bacterium]|nr:MAG: flagellar M-ring protein FliF [Microbacteriaceae bacterium]
MPRQLSALLRRLGSTARAFSVAQRTIAIIGIAAVVLGGIAVTAWLSTPTYTPLFTGLAAADASSVVDQLNADGVKYQLTDGGATILVPNDQVYAERLKAAASGLPASSNSGYALLDKMGVTSSEFQQNVMYKQAMEDELAKTISAMNGIKTASVKLAIPKATVFTEMQADPTASVFIQTNAGTTLTSDQVDAIVHLTSASIENMKPTDVAVIDSNGETLSAVGTGTVGSSDKLTNAYEAKSQSAVQAMLDRILGPGNSTVAVSASLSNSTGTKVSETYLTPDKSPVLSQSTQSENYAGGASGTSAGVLGPDNIAVPSGTATSGTGGYTSVNEVKNNAINKTTETDSIPAGSVVRQTVSVAISAAAARKLNTANIKSLVASAVGFDQSRGDVVTVETVGFSGSQAAAAQQSLRAAAAQQENERIAGYIRAAEIGGGIIVAVLLAWFLFFRRSRGRRETMDLSELDAAEQAGELKELLTVRAAAIEPADLPELGDGAGGLDTKRAQISTLANHDPERAAALLRGMMEERPS